MRGEMVEDGRTERDLSNVRVRKRLQYITNINKSPPFPRYPSHPEKNFHDNEGCGLFFYKVYELRRRVRLYASESFF